MNDASVLDSEQPQAAPNTTPTASLAKLSEPGILIPALILGLTFLVYAATLKYEFVYDDVGIIVNNPVVHSWRFVPRFFTEHVWGYLYPNAPGNYYRPVFMLWLLINHTLFGDAPFGWHLTTLLTHLLATFLVYRLALRVTDDFRVAAAASLIFGLHPVHIEAVAWVSGVSEPLLIVLALGSFLCYLRYRADRLGKWLVGSLVLFVLAVLAKETAVVVPAMVFFYELLFARRGSPAPGEEGEDDATPKPLPQRSRLAGAVIGALPFGLFAAVYLVVRIIVLKGLGHAIVPLSLASVLYTLPSVLWFYIRALVWPLHLSAFYEAPAINSPSFSNFLLPLVGVLIVAAFLVWLAMRSRAARFAVIWLVLPILPLLYLPIFQAGEIIHDRYVYMPSVGFAILIGAAVARLRIGEKMVAGHPSAAVYAAAALALLLSVGTLAQQRHWANNFSLFSVSAGRAPNNSVVINNLANEVLARGDYDQAIHLYQRVLARDPGFWLANYNLGFAYYKLDELESAERYLTRAIEIKRSDADQYLYLGLTRMKGGHLDQAVLLIRRAIAMRPDAVGYHYALGAVLKKQGDLPGALQEFNAELVNNPAQGAAKQQITDIEGKLNQRAQ